MNSFTHTFISALLIGVGATLTFDLWGLFLKHAFHMMPSNICLVGRWLCYMADGTFRHTNLPSAPQKPAECAMGWVAHYTIGILFALTFVALVGRSWLQQPTPMPGILFGMATVCAPLFIMQPLWGLGVAAAKAANPSQARLRSLMNHAAFGLGLYLFGLLASCLF